MTKPILSNVVKAVEAVNENVAALSEEMANLHPSAMVVDTEIGAKCAEYAALFNGTDKVDSFIFFTDPHLTEGQSGYEAGMRTYLKTLKAYYDATPTNYVVCGGDWLGNSDTIAEACFKLGFINGTMRSMIEPYYPVVGNHDTNYQGKSTSVSTEFDGTLTNATIRNLFVPGEEKNYYSFDGANTKYYVLDTGSDWVSAMNDYRWEQLAWLAERLKTDDAAFSAIILHIGKATFAQTIYSLCYAYNQATTITLNDVTYDFTACQGKVKFALAGHTHADSVEVDNGIIVVTTTQMKDGSVPTFDLCLADYDNDVLHMVRVGSGAGRTISLSDGTTDEDDTGSSEDDESQESEVYLLRGFTRTGTHLYPVSNRSAYISKTPCYEITPATQYDQFDYTDLEWDDYYPIMIPDGATKAVVTCPSDTKWLVLTSDLTTGGFAEGSTTSDWIGTGGGTWDIPEGHKTIIVLFHNNNGTDVTDDAYDTSEFSLTFASGDDTEDDESQELPITNSDISGVEFLLKITCTGYNVYSAAARSSMLTTVNDGMPRPYTEYNDFVYPDGVSYYPIAIPDGATQLTVNCTGLEWECFTWDTTPQNLACLPETGVWYESGATTTLTSSATHIELRFKMADGSNFPDDYDGSHVTFTFS